MGLSPLWVDRVLELIATINQQGATIFMVEQNANLALQIAHDAYVLQTGRIVLARLGRRASQRSAHSRRLSRRRVVRRLKEAPMSLPYPLTARQRRIADLAETLAQRLAPAAAEHDRRGAFALENLRRAARGGLSPARAARAPMAARGPTCSTWSIAQQRLARGDPASALVVGMTLNVHRPPARRAHLAEPVLRRRSAATSPSMAARSTPARPRPISAASRAAARRRRPRRRRAGGYLVNGRKIFVTGAPGLRWFVTLVRLPPSADAPHGEVGERASSRRARPGLRSRTAGPAR